MSRGTLAWAALGLTLVIWASFLVVTRAAMTARLGVIEVGLIRFGTGALLFAPVLIRHGIVPRGARWHHVAAIPLFGGILFIALLANGLKIAPVADSGVFTPAMLPIYVAVLSALVLGERFTGLRLLGFALILGGALAVGGWTALSQGAGVWRGHLLFTLASLSWAVYTVAFRLSGLRAVEAAAILCFWSAVAFGVAALVWGVDFASIPARTLWIQVLFQGVLSGFVASFTFFHAVSHIGASRSAACAALVPVLAALGGWAVLAEPIGAGKAVGIVIVAAGVALASGVLSRRQRVAQQ